LDHTVPFQPGRSGQTRVGNLAPLTRRVHRAKTAGVLDHAPTDTGQDRVAFPARVPLRRDPVRHRALPPHPLQPQPQPPPPPPPTPTTRTRPR
jgi:hypothetical protein